MKRFITLIFILMSAVGHAQTNTSVEFIAYKTELLVFNKNANKWEKLQEFSPTNILITFYQGRKLVIDAETKGIITLLSSLEKSITAESTIFQWTAKRNNDCIVMLTQFKSSLTILDILENGYCFKYYIK